MWKFYISALSSTVMLCGIGAAIVNVDKPNTAKPKIVFINCYTNDSYYKIVDSLIEAERISTLFAIDLEQVNSEKVLQKYKFKKI